MPKETVVPHRIMYQTLPDILDELEAKIKRAEQAALDAEGHSADAKAYAEQAKGEAAAATKKEIDYILPRLTEAQGTAGKALKLAEVAQQNAEQALRHLADDVFPTLKLVREEIRELGLAVVNGLKGYGEFIVSHVSFLKIKDE